MEHGLVKYEYQANSYAQYRHYCECKCGWQCRLGTEEASKTQFDAHLEHHMQRAHFKNLPVVDDSAKVLDNKTGEFKPVFK